MQSLMIPLAIPLLFGPGLDPELEVRQADPLESVLDALQPGTSAAARAGAFERAAASGDRRFLAPLVDLLRFAETREEWFAVLDAFGALVGEDLRELERPWYHLTLRLADDPELPLFDAYPRWKGELLSRLVDPRMGAFLFEGVASRVRLDEVVWGGVPVDGIPSLDDPRTFANMDAQAAQWADEEPIFGLALGGEARAYPLRILDWHEMVNDVIGGMPVALSYCTLCGAAIAYRAVHEEQRLSFGSSGLLMRSNKLMYDRASNSLWNQLTGEPVLGPLAHSGVRLEVLPVVATTWGAWRAMHPDSRVLDPDTGVRRDNRLGASYGSYFGGERLMFPAPAGGGSDERRAGGGAVHAAKDQVFVLRDGERVAAFSREEIERRKVWNVRTEDGSRYVLVAEHARPTVPLPQALSVLLRNESHRERPSSDQRGSAGSDGGGPRRSSSVLMAELRLDDLLRLFELAPNELGELSDEALLALVPQVRRRFADELAARGVGTPLEQRLRGGLAVRALAFEVRAYASGTRELAWEQASGRIVDQDGMPWRRLEDALVASDGRRLKRVGGHLAFRFGYEAFLAGRPDRRER